MRFTHLLTQPRRNPQRPNNPGSPSQGSRIARPGDGSRSLSSSRQR